MGITGYSPTRRWVCRPSPTWPRSTTKKARGIRCTRPRTVGPLRRRAGRCLRVGGRCRRLRNGYCFTACEPAGSKGLLPEVGIQGFQGFLSCTKVPVYIFKRQQHRPSRLTPSSLAIRSHVVGGRPRAPAFFFGRSPARIATRIFSSRRARVARLLLFFEATERTRGLRQKV